MEVQSLVVPERVTFSQFNKAGNNKIKDLYSNRIISQSRQVSVPRDRPVQNKLEFKNKIFFEMAQSNKKVSHDLGIQSLKKYLQSQNRLRDFRTINPYVEMGYSDFNASTMNNSMLPSIQRSELDVAKLRKQAAVQRILSKKSQAYTGVSGGLSMTSVIEHRLNTLSSDSS